MTVFKASVSDGVITSVPSDLCLFLITSATSDCTVNELLFLHPIFPPSPCWRVAPARVSQPSSFQPLTKSFTQKPLKQPVFSSKAALSEPGGHSQPIRVYHRTSMGALSSLPNEWRNMPCNERTDGLLFVLCSSLSSAVMSLNLRNTLWLHTTLNSHATCVANT